MTDSFNARTTLEVDKREYHILSLAALKAHNVSRLPFSLKILLENLLRFEDGVNVKSGRTSPACRASSIWRRCARPSCAWAAIRSA
jgi:aconitate hydratase